MNVVRRTPLFLAVLAAGAAGIWAGTAYSGKGGSGLAVAAPSDEPAASSLDAGPVASVKVATIEQGTIREDLTAYGTVVAALGETYAVSVPYECRVRKVLVAGGQVVTKGASLVEIEPSPDAAYELEQAVGDRDAAKAALELVRQRVGMKLSTRSAELAAEQALATATRKLASLKERGIDGVRTLRSPEPAVVDDIATGPGAIVPAGASLLREVGEDHISVRLGIEAENVGRLHVGQEVELDPVDDPGGRTVAGKIRLITRRVDPATRLVDVFVTPPSGSHLLLNAYIRGTLTARVANGLLVPRSAVRPVDGHEVLFTVRNGKAVRHDVEIGIADSSRYQVISNSLAAGSTVVVDGNAELTDGMAVTAEPVR